MIEKLTFRQRKFVDSYIETAGNATEAYKIAGYNVKDDNSAAAGAQQILRNIKVQARLKEISKEVKSRKIADTVECQEILTELARNKKVYPKGRVAALNTLLKAQGAFSQNVNVVGAVPVVLVDDVRE